MVSVGLLYVGAVLIVNGLMLLGRIDAWAAAPRRERHRRTCTPMTEHGSWSSGTWAEGPKDLQLSVGQSPAGRRRSGRGRPPLMDEGLHQWPRGVLDALTTWQPSSSPLR
jgi:hypothetical protein